MGEIWARYRGDIGEHGGSQALPYTPLHPPISHPYLPHISVPYLPCISHTSPIVSPLYLAGARGARGGGGDARRLEAGARVSLSLSTTPRLPRDAAGGAALPRAILATSFSSVPSVPAASESPSVGVALRRYPPRHSVARCVWVGCNCSDSQWSESAHSQ